MSRQLRTDGGENALEARLDSLATTLRETEELPVSPDVSVWLGEAHAVAEDLTHGDVAAHVVAERVGHVEHLLENAGDVGNERVADAVEEALAIAEAILTEVEE